MSASGKLKFFSDEKGYGFIIPDLGGPDVLLHRSKLPIDGPSITTLAIGTPLTFDTEETPRGLRATNIKWRAAHG